VTGLPCPRPRVNTSSRRKRSTEAETGPALSSRKAWPPGWTSKRARGRSFASASVADGGTRASSLPARTSAHEAAEREPEHVHRAEREVLEQRERIRRERLEIGVLLDGIENAPALEVGAGIVVGALVPQAGTATFVDEVVDLAGDVLT